MHKLRFIRGRSRLVGILAAAALMAGCASSATSYDTPQPQGSRDNPYATNQGNLKEVEPIHLDFVNVETSHRFSTPLTVGITASNSCARIVSHNVYRKGDGINISLDVWEGFHVGYECSKAQSRLQKRIILPYALREGQPYAIQVIVNGQPRGIVETTPRAIYQNSAPQNSGTHRQNGNTLLPPGYPQSAAPARRY